MQQLAFIPENFDEEQDDFIPVLEQLWKEEWMSEKGILSSRNSQVIVCCDDKVVITLFKLQE